MNRLKVTLKRSLTEDQRGVARSLDEFFEWFMGLRLKWAAQYAKDFAEKNATSFSKAMSDRLSSPNLAQDSGVRLSDLLSEALLRREPIQHIPVEPLRPTVFGIPIIEDPQIPEGQMLIVSRQDGSRVVAAHPAHAARLRQELGRDDMLRMPIITGVQGEGRGGGGGNMVFTLPHNSGRNVYFNIGGGGGAEGNPAYIIAPDDEPDET